MALGFKLFGFSIQRASDSQKSPPQAKLAVPRSDDGATVISSGGAYDSVLALDPTRIIGNECELINQYRNMALQDTCAEAIESIVNESMIYDDNTNDVVRLILDDAELDEGLKDQLQDEFDYCLNLLDFKTRNHDIFKQWYVDGRLFYQVVVDKDNASEGIQELVPLDPRTIKKVKEIEVEFERDTGTQTIKKTKEYFIYDPKGISITPSYSIGTMRALNAQGTQVAPDSVVYIHSGTFDTSHTVILSHLHKAIKPLNQLINIEDALVIYRLARAPERLVFYVDVGGLPPQKAESYLKNLMASFKNKLSYNSATGEIASQTRISTMTENYWLPRKEGGKATEITSLAAGANLGQTEDLEYFKKKLYRALNIPVTRIDPGGGGGGGGSNNGGMAMQSRATEILRDEVKFSRFLARLRRRFSDLFYQILRRHLILKGIIKPDDWEFIKDQLKFEFPIDNHFTELKDLEIQQRRLDIAGAMDPYVGKYYSREFIKMNILKLTAEQLSQMDEEMAQEAPDLEAEQADELDADVTRNEALGAAAADAVDTEGNMIPGGMDEDEADEQRGPGDEGPEDQGTDDEDQDFALDDDEEGPPVGLKKNKAKPAFGKKPKPGGKPFKKFVGKKP